MEVAMDREERARKIIDYLKIKPIEHGKLDVSIIHVPEPGSIAPERIALVRPSIAARKSNLIPLVVKPINHPDYEYEVVYGAEWCLAAAQVGVNTLWVWLCNTEEQAQQTLAEMQILLGDTSQPVLPPASIADPIPELPELQLEKLFDRKLQQWLSDDIQKLTKQLQVIQEKLDLLSKKITAPAQPTSQTLAAQDNKINKTNLEKLPLTKLEDMARKLEVRIKPNPNETEIIEAILSHFKKLTVRELKIMIKELGIKIKSKSRKPEIIEEILSHLEK